MTKFIKTAIVSLIGIVATLVARHYWHNRLELGPETTVLISPLTPEGLPDYFGELNREARVGVTPENNAAVVLLQMLDENPYRPEQMRLLFEELQLVPDSDSPRLQTIIDFVRDGVDRDVDRDNAVESLLRAHRAQARSKPWRTGAYPELEQWIASNDAVIPGLIEGSRRPRYYVPLSRGSLQIGGWERLEELHREAHSLLLAKSMRELGEGHAGPAGEAAMAALRWARLLNFSMAQEDTLQSWANWSIATFALAQVLDRPEAGPFLDTWEVEFLALCDRPHMADVQNRVGRFKWLHQIVGTADADGMYWPSVNKSLRTINRDIDRFVLVLRCPTYQEREMSLYALLPMSASPPSPPTAADMRQFDEMLRLYEQIHSRHSRMQVRDRLLELKFSVAKYHRDHHSWPKDLAELMPDYLTKILNDPYSETPQWIYRRKELGMELYSPGPNGEDESDDPANSEANDDIGLYDRFSAQPVDAVD